MGRRGGEGEGAQSYRGFLHLQGEGPPHSAGLQQYLSKWRRAVPWLSSD